MHRTRVLRPAPGVLAFYEGRIEGYRFAEGRNWVDEGAISLGIASYAIVDGEAALVYDTHVSVEHARFVRETLEAEGASELTVVLSHWHLDHVAGTAAFPGAEVIASERTAEHLVQKQAAIEAGTLEGPPAIDPLVLPTRTYSGRERLPVGGPGGRADRGEHPQRRRDRAVAARAAPAALRRHDGGHGHLRRRAARRSRLTSRISTGYGSWTPIGSSRTTAIRT